MAAGKSPQPSKVGLRRFLGAYGWGLAVAILIVVAAWLYPLPSISKSGAIVNASAIARIHSGDLIFRRGRELVSRMVLAVDASGDYSHVGLAWVHDGQVSVIHALPRDETGKNGVLVEPIEVFASNANASAIGVYRGNETLEMMQKVAEYALTYKGRPFDDNFDLEHQESLYCTELAWVAYNAFGLKLVDAFDYLRLPMKTGWYLLPGRVLESPRIFKVFSIKQTI